jgi:integrase
MRPIGLGEHGEIFFDTDHLGRPVAMIYYRDFGGRKRRLKRSGATKAAAQRALMKALEDALRSTREGEFTPRSPLSDGLRAWLELFESQVERGTRSPSTLDLYRHAIDRHVLPGVGQLRLGEVTTARLDRFVQAILADKGVPTAKLCRQVLSGTCGLLVRRGGLSSNPVRDLTPIEQDRDRAARAMTAKDVREWLAVVDASEFAQRWDLPELTRFMLATGVRLGEALGVRWSDLDAERGTISIERTVIRLRGQGLVAAKPKTRTSARVLVLPGWCLRMLKERRVRRGAFEGPIFADSRGGYRDRNNVGAAFRTVRQGTRFDWVTPHTFRKTVATLLDGDGASARQVADQLGHARVSMTQDVYMGRRAVDSANADALERHDPDRPTPDPGTDPGPERAGGSA